MALQEFGRFLKRFGQDTKGSITVEFVIMMPLLFWAFMACYVFFDGFRQSATDLKAAYTISDVLSRQTDAVDDDYIDSMKSLFDFLSDADGHTAIRVSVVRWNEADDRYYVDWSAVSGISQKMTDDNVMEYSDKLPVMANSDRLIIVETKSTFRPVANVGLAERDLRNFVVSRPRFAPQLAWSGTV